VKDPENTGGKSDLAVRWNIEGAGSESDTVTGIINDSNGETYEHWNAQVVGFSLCPNPVDTVD